MCDGAEHTPVFKSIVPKAAQDTRVQEWQINGLDEGLRCKCAAIARKHKILSQKASNIFINIGNPFICV